MASPAPADRALCGEQRPRPFDQHDEPIEASADLGEGVTFRRPPTNGHRLVVLRPADNIGPEPS